MLISAKIKQIIAKGFLTPDLNPEDVIYLWGRGTADRGCGMESEIGRSELPTSFLFPTSLVVSRLFVVLL